MKQLEIAIPIFDRLTALDAIGPYEVLQRLPGATVTFVADRLGEHRTENGFLGLIADAVFADMPKPDVVVAPGGIGSRAFLDGASYPILDWLVEAHEHTRFTTSVCTGSLLLAKAGLLEGLEATTHWAEHATLTRLGAVSTPKRVVEHLDQRIVTAAGVSAGIDMALRLSELLVDADAAKAMQLMIEYDPQPPFAAGNVETAGPAAMSRVIEYAAHKG